MIREFEYITLARVLIAKKSWEDALLLLARLLVFAENEDRLPSILEVMNLQALALYAFGETDKSMVALQKSLSLAEKERYLRKIVDEEAPMAVLLPCFLSRRQKQDSEEVDGVSTGYVKKLFELTRDFGLVLKPLSQTSCNCKPTVEQLTKRETEVLRLLARGDSNQKIAAQLCLSTSTVKSHLRNIFSKLAVKNRTEAVRRARDMGILP